MAIGRTQQESMQKALRGLEVGSEGFDPILDLSAEDARDELIHELTQPGAERIWYIGDAFRMGMSVDEIYKLSGVDPWFLIQIEDLIKDEKRVSETALSELTGDMIFRLKRKGFSDGRLAKLLGVSEKQFRKQRQKLNVRPVFKRVDTCSD